ncbi:hypothetical protein MYK68_15950 [Gordonia sp. PP30]|uniref:hypothetical protein n=1 Tax=Gordonia sp. PP30 TaxID=2935861 RepID=UPI001FFFC669|nr:hypothetical protein [Gordonia sp. PP30]UQE74204.1 hypothetical protein MYK68_15950 [Gordonia sp. PP30]
MYDLDDPTTWPGDCGAIIEATAPGRHAAWAAQATLDSITDLIGVPRYTLDLDDLRLGTIPGRPYAHA